MRHLDLFSRLLLVFTFSGHGYCPVWIVTNERIIDIEQRGLFRRTTSELHLAAIQDVTSDVHGILQIGLDYGDVFIQTAGETGRFNFKNIPHPEKIKQRVLQLVDEDRKRHKVSDPQSGTTGRET